MVGACAGCLLVEQGFKAKESGGIAIVLTCHEILLTLSKILGKYLATHLLPDENHKHDYGNVQYAFLLNFIMYLLTMLCGIYLNK